MIILRGYVYDTMYCSHCNADVEPILYSASSMDYLDLDCPKCERHLTTLHRSGGPQLGLELNMAIVEAKTSKSWRTHDSN